MIRKMHTAKKNYRIRSSTCLTIKLKTFGWGVVVIIFHRIWQAVRRRKPETRFEFSSYVAYLWIIAQGLLE